MGLGDCPSLLLRLSGWTVKTDSGTAQAYQVAPGAGLLGPHVAPPAALTRTQRPRNHSSVSDAQGGATEIAGYVGRGWPAKNKPGKVKKRTRGLASEMKNKLEL